MTAKLQISHLRRVAFIGSATPRKCGIATFTADLRQALYDIAPKTDWFQIAVNDQEEGYAYQPQVRFEIAEKDLASYRRAADFLNTRSTNVLSVQHEYGLFGGPAGSHLLALLRDLRMPIVTTCHTVLREPDQHQRQVLSELIRLSSQMVVMSRRAAEFLKEIYHAPDEKIEIIPHGIPDIPFVDASFYKDQFGVEGKTVMLTFGLLGPNKGIENVITALPQILKRFPNTVYVVLGATHPHLLRREGESYRLSLERLVQELGVEGSVIFHNRFVEKEELMEFLCASDIYVSPYPHVAQITSGTLAYAVGCGKAIVSTPYWHAEELLAEQRGILIPFNDPAAIANAVEGLLANEPQRHAMRKRAYLAGREMIWMRVAEQYLRTFDKALAERKEPLASALVTLDRRPRELPVLRLDHLQRMSDRTGILQHAMFTIPDFSHGYTTDDNARALILAVLLEQLDESPAAAQQLAVIYLSFLWYAFDPKTNHFRNLLSYDHRWIDEGTSEDGHGRALWALGLLIGRSKDEGLCGLATRMLDRALKTVVEFTSPRAWAFTLLGTHEYLRRFSGDRNAQQIFEMLSTRLWQLYQHNRSEDWHWFEQDLTYSNAKLPHALLCGGTRLNRPELIAAGLESLEWLMLMQRGTEGHFVPIGSNGWHRRGGERSRFDQQPIEAYTSISACLEAHRVTGEAKWQKHAQVSFDWFLGRNDLRQPLYDPATGGCRDGLHQDRVNQNQGAESTLACLLACVEMELAQSVIRE